MNNYIYNYYGDITAIDKMYELPTKTLSTKQKMKQQIKNIFKKCHLEKELLLLHQMYIHFGSILKNIVKVIVDLFKLIFLIIKLPYRFIKYLLKR